MFKFGAQKEKTEKYLQLLLILQCWRYQDFTD